MEYSIQDIIEYIVQDSGMEYDQAMHMFYNSQTFDKLMNTESGLYLESSAYVYRIFQGKRNFGSLMQTEIGYGQSITEPAFYVKVAEMDGKYYKAAAKELQQKWFLNFLGIKSSERTAMCKLYKNNCA